MLLLPFLLLAEWASGATGGPLSLPLYTWTWNELFLDDATSRRIAERAMSQKGHASFSRKPPPPARLPVGNGVERFAGQFYVVKDFKIGNPPQYFNLTLHSDTHWTYVFSNALAQWKCDEAPAKRNFFSAYRSTTYRSSGDPALVDVYLAINRKLSCLPDDWFPYGFGSQATDDVRLGIQSAPQKRIPFVVVTEINGTLDANWRSDGKLGLMRNGGEYEKGLSTIQHLASSLGSPEVSLFFRKDPKVGMDAGLLTIGGKDTENCGSNWAYFGGDDQLGQGSELGWELTVTAFKIGAKSFAQTTYVDFETSVSQIVASPVGYAEIVLQTNAQYDPTFAGYVVDCSKTAGFPSLEFTLPSLNGTFQLTVPASDYVSKLEDGRCFLNIGFEPSDDGWTLGTSVKGYCWLMHYGDGSASSEMFGLAKAL